MWDWVFGIGGQADRTPPTPGSRLDSPSRIPNPESLNPDILMSTDHANSPGVLTPTRAGRPWGSILLFVGPALGFYLAFIIYPVLVTFYNSVHTLRMDLGMTYEFVGLQHFREML